MLAARMWPRIQPTPNTGDSDALDTARPLRDNCPAQGVSGMSLYGSIMTTVAGWLQMFDSRLTLHRS